MLIYLLWIIILKQAEMLGFTNDKMQKNLKTKDYYAIVFKEGHLPEGQNEKKRRSTLAQSKTDGLCKNDTGGLKIFKMKRLWKEKKTYAKIRKYISDQENY